MTAPGALLQVMLERSYVALRDIATAGTLRQVPAGTYDTATRTYTAGAATDILVNVILTRYRGAELEADTILHTDLKALIRQAEVPTVPKATDTLLLSGVAWHVLAIDQDTAAGLWILQIRRQGTL